MIGYDRLRQIVNGKLVDHTMQDSYESLSEEIFGEGNAYSSSEVRKRLYGMKRLFDVIDNEGTIIGHQEELTHGVDVLEFLPVTKEEKKILEAKKEQQKLRDQRREFTKLIASDARLDHITDRLLDAAYKLNEERPLTVDRTAYDATDNEAVLVLTDWHFGMVAGNMWNRFDVEVCKRRVGQLVAEVRKRLEFHRPKKLHVLLLGDFCHGACHVTARVASEELVCEQLMHVSELLAETIAELAQHVDDTLVYSTYGNHMRVMQSKKDNIHYDNFERLIPWWLRQRLAGTGICVSESEFPEFATVIACDKFVIVGVHGDLQSGKNTGITLSSLYHKQKGFPVDCVVMGDRHHHEEFEAHGVDVVTVGSLCGTDEYANTKRLYSMPSQMLIFFNPLCGRDATYTIRLE